MEFNYIKSLESLIPIIITGLITSFLTYYFGIKSKNYEFEKEKKKIRNKIHSDLLEVKYYKENLIRYFKMMESNEQRSMFPKDIILKAIDSDKKLNPDCFENAEKSIQELKSYDPKLFNKLSGFGRTFNDFINNPHYKYMRDTSTLDPVLKQYYTTFLNGLDSLIINAIEMVDNEPKIRKKLKNVWPFKEKEENDSDPNLEDIRKVFLSEVRKAQGNESDDEESAKLLESADPEVLKDLRNLMNQDMSTLNFEKLLELRRLYPDKTEAELIEMMNNGEV